VLDCGILSIISEKNPRQGLEGIPESSRKAFENYRFVK
jgi:hypothetical protein